MTYNRLNNLVGWGVFAIALLTYGLTVEPTASFWDCGEFIATANELEVPHPPGAPFHLLTGRFFALVGHLLGGPTAVALAVNWVSVMASAALALFICWTTTLLAKKVLAPAEGEPDAQTRLLILFSGAVAGLTCTFLDTVWFNAVEAEVYAYSSAFTAAVFWLMLKWEARAGTPQGTRLLIFISYLIGLAVGVHLLPLLTIPTLVLIYFFKKYTFSWAKLLLAFGLSIAGLLFVQVFVVQSTWDIAWAFERFLVGTENFDGSDAKGLGLPMGSGVLVFTLLLLTGLIVLIWFANRKTNFASAYGIGTAKPGQTWLPGAFMLSVALLMVYLGFSSYAIIGIRSNVDPAVDQNNPGSVNNFLYYVKREQYGSAPLLHGQMYNSPIIDYKDGKKQYLYLDNHDRYIFDGNRREYVYEPGSLRFFPRMHNPDHYDSGPHGYKNYVRNKGADPNDPRDDKPTGLDNMRFFFGYQVNHMYIRYLLWNFVGRSSDEQHAPAESGLNFGQLKEMPRDLRNIPTRNHYFYLPLLLGLLGFIWHWQADPKRAGVVSVLFLFTGLAIVIFLNQVAQEPRERDYAFVGSYHTFAIWVGLGVILFAQALRGIAKRAAPIIAGVLSLVLVPGLLAAENWDDHSRAHRYIAPDAAYNLLNSCAPNAILFTNGDNDTFPLWYLQEVEGIRTDVRVVNLSLLNTDWYIYQLKYKQWNDSPPVPITLPEDRYMGDRSALVPFRQQTLRFEVDTKALLANGVISEADTARVESPMLVSVKPRGSQQNPYLQKQDVLILNILTNVARDGWKRPVYFANTVGPSNYVSLAPYFELQGLAMRVLPIRDARNTDNFTNNINRELMYTNLVEKFRYRGLNDPRVFVDENANRMITNFRNSFYTLASSYIQAAQQAEQRAQALQATATAGPEAPEAAALQEEAATYRARARQLIDFSLEAMAPGTVDLPVNTQLLYGSIYQEAGQQAAADSLFSDLTARSLEHARYYKARGGTRSADFQRALMPLQQVLYFHLENRNQPAALSLAQELFLLTGDPQYQQIARGLEAGKTLPELLGQ